MGTCFRKKSNPAKLMFTASELKVDEIKTEVSQIDDISDRLTEIREKIQYANSNLDEMKTGFDN